MVGVVAITPLLLALPAPVIGQADLARIVAYKNAAPGRPIGSPTPPFTAIPPGLASAAGYTLVADYTARVLYEGPSSGASGLVQTFRSAGLHAEVTTELDTISFNDFSIYADTGASVPEILPWTPPAGGEGLYLLALRGYPTPEWLADLRQRNVRLIEALPPAAYLVRGPRSVLANLRSLVSYVRGVFAVTPQMKKVFFQGQLPAELRVSIDAVEETAQDSIAAYLRGLDPELIERRAQGRARFRARLSQVDLATLSNFDVVYSIAPLGEARLSDERQATLVLSPSVVNGRLELPASAPGYTNILTLPAGRPLRIVWIALAVHRVVPDIAGDSGSPPPLS